jgi:adenosylcobinamide kinase / adenosylcobinamide-phosphate guanylyltransferase
VKELILGGVRSGKSRLAERRARDSGRPVTYVATARPSDDPEMIERIAAHRARRPADWRLVEEPTGLAGCLRSRALAGHVMVIECLTLWLTNLLLLSDAQALERERDAFVAAVGEARGDLILVSNETGLGVVPPGELTRRFIDEMGALHQRLAALCDRVSLMVAGLPLIVKGEST